MASFYVKNGCFYYKGKPFIKTSAYHGGDYIISLPEELVISDKNLYLKAGFTSADYFATWKRVHPAEDFWNLEPLRTLLRKAQKMGITVFIHFYPNPPRWMIEKYNWYWITETGKRVPMDIVGGYPHDENYLKEMENYIKRLIEVGLEYEDALGDYWICSENWPFLPSFKERKIYGVREDASYDDYTVNKFKKWLSQQFSLEELSKRWNNDEKTYSSWNEVYPPVSFKKTDFKGRKLAKWKVARWDWYRFKQYVSVDILTKFYNIVHKYDPYRPISLEMNMDLPGWYGYQRWYKVCSRAKNARAAIQDFEASYVRALYYITIARGSSEPPHQVNEMSGFQDHHWCIRNAWFVQAMGGTGMTFWDFKSDYWGLVTSQKCEYDPREKVQFKSSFLAVMELNKTFRRLSDILGASPPLRPKIGILILDEDSYHESGVAIPPTMRYLSLLLKLGFGAETAIINEEYLNNGRIYDYNIVIAPHIKYISYEEAKGLREYVKRGGVLLVGPFCGECDEKGEFYDEIPCKPLMEITGIKANVDINKELLIHLYRVIKYLPERVKAGNWLLETFNQFQANKMLLTIDRTFAFDYINRLIDEYSSSLEILRDFYELKKGIKNWCLPAQEIEVINENVKIIAKYDEKPAITLNKYGNGYVIYLAIDLTNKLLEKVLRSSLLLARLSPYSKITPEEKNEDIILGARRFKNGYLIFLIEAKDQSHKITLEFNKERIGLSEREYEIKELLSEKTFKINGKDPRLDIILKDCDVKIFHVAP